MDIRDTRIAEGKAFMVETKPPSMINYDKSNKILTMDIVNLQHCGFNEHDLLSELFLSGKWENDEAMFNVLKECRTLVVNMR